jgi:class 3 adenylate cyclase
LVGAYLEAASTAVTEIGGKVAKKLGDGLMALFGYQVAQENDAERAVRAALSIQSALAALNRYLRWGDMIRLGESGSKLANCSLRSMAGSLRGSTRAI